jgi:hypothetical protein
LNRRKTGNQALQLAELFSIKMTRCLLMFEGVYAALKWHSDWQRAAAMGDVTASMRSDRAALMHERSPPIYRLIDRMEQRYNRGCSS